MCVIYKEGAKDPRVISMYTPKWSCVELFKIQRHI